MDDLILNLLSVRHIHIWCPFIIHETPTPLLYQRNAGDKRYGFAYFNFYEMKLVPFAIVLKPLRLMGQLLFQKNVLLLPFLIGYDNPDTYSYAVLFLYYFAFRSLCCTVAALVILQIPFGMGTTTTCWGGWIHCIVHGSNNPCTCVFIMPVVATCKYMPAAATLRVHVAVPYEIEVG